MDLCSSNLCCVKVNCTSIFFLKEANTINTEVWSGSLVRLPLMKPAQIELEPAFLWIPCIFSYEILMHKILFCIYMLVTLLCPHTPPKEGKLKTSRIWIMTLIFTFNVLPHWVKGGFHKYLIIGFYFCIKMCNYTNKSSTEENIM